MEDIQLNYLLINIFLLNAIPCSIAEYLPTIQPVLSVHTPAQKFRSGPFTVILEGAECENNPGANANKNFFIQENVSPNEIFILMLEPPIEIGKVILTNSENYYNEFRK